jgi:uncharacterized surface protein with fasciclin (FAS1) repeats
MLQSCYQRADEHGKINIWFQMSILLQLSKITKCFSIFLQAMERVMVNSPETLELQNPAASYTFFVPTDQAFNRLGAERLQRIMQDPAYLTKV